MHASHSARAFVVSGTRRPGLPALADGSGRDVPARAAFPARPRAEPHGTSPRGASAGR